MTLPAGPWTSHGHPVDGVTVVGPGRPPVARCGGPAICSKCALDAEQIRARPRVVDGPQLELTEPVLIIDPRRQFGKVCVIGTRVPAESVAGRVAAGDSVDATAKDYGITRDQVLTACWWWATEGCVGRSREAVATRKAWGGPRRIGGPWAGNDSWAFEAAMVLGGHREGPLSDPPEVPDD